MTTKSNHLKGNKYALKPRPQRKFTDDEVIAFGEDLLDWVDNQGKDQFMFVDWYYNRHRLFRSEWKTLIQRVCFLPYYEIARKKLTSNIVKNKEIAQSYGNRYLCMYDDELHGFEEDNKDKESERRISEKQHEPTVSLTLSDLVKKGEGEKFIKDISQK